MTEIQVVVMAAGAWWAAAVGLPIAVAPAVAALGIALVSRRTWLVIGAVLVLAGAASTHADQSYVIVGPGSYRGDVTLVTDPEELSFGWRADVALDDGRRVRLVADRGAGAALRSAVAGATLEVDGCLSPVDVRPWFRSRHLVGSLSADAIRSNGDGLPWHLVPSQTLRSLVFSGSEPLPAGSRALYRGLVIGDDREQAPGQQARFRVAGLSHLLAVSGQNVAFALAVISPIVRRAGRNGGLFLTMLALAVFAVATRLEPSVVRATVTAGIASLAVVLGRPTGGIRALALAVTALIVVDPFLVDSVGFRLSVGASAGILLLGPAIRARLPGPQVLADPTAVTMAAQLGVMPILTATFGPVSLVTIPANVLAGGAAGLVMSWGLSVGVLAGLMPGSVAAVIQLPANVLVSWIDGVATWASRVPAPTLGPFVASLVASGLVLRWAVGLHRTAARLVVAGLLLALVARVPTGPARIEHATFIPAIEGTPSVLILDGQSDLRLIDELVEERVSSIDLVIAVGGGRRTADLVRSVQSISSVSVVIAPPAHRIRGARRVLSPIELVVADGVLVVEPDADRLVVSHR